jgi:LemA protein
MNITTILLIIIVAVVVWAVLAYNGLVRLRNRAKEAFSDIDVQLKRRFDLVPNLVNTVKGYAAHESTVFEKVTEARAKVATGGSLKERAESENMLTQTLKTLFAVAENYPDLKANANFLELQRELSDTENKIQSARRFYNGNVRDLNTRIETFPTNIVASAFNFIKMEFFELGAEEEKEPVKVAF